MTILRVEDVVYGVEDLPAAIKFHEDWGMAAVERGEHGADFALPSGQMVRLRKATDPGLPATKESGSTLREAVWGVDDADALDELAGTIEKDQAVSRDAAGVLHMRDPNGFALGLRVAAPKTIVDAPPADRRNRPFAPVAVKPRRIGHVVYFVSKDKQKEGSDFYTGKLGFRVSDRAMDLGDFLRAEGSYDHHNLGLFWFRNQSHFAHVAYEVASFDEVMLGGKNMEKQGWTPSNKPGRHIIGSNTFWNFQNPAGGNSEYFHDMDVMDDEWKTRVWEKFPGLAHWMTE
jgi:catechol 2,3-dioxygenase-like lactoylglutathione lyase family enzyme